MYIHLLLELYTALLLTAFFDV